MLGSGFVGEAVRRRLAGAPDLEVVAMPTGSLRSRDEDATRELRAAVADGGARAVVNTAGLLRGSDDELHDANVAWPTWLAEAVLPGTGARLVHLGSAAEYGDPGSAEPVPETAPVHPVGAYGTTKWAGSRAVLAARDGGLDAVVARGFNLVGPKVAEVSPLHQFARDVAALPDAGGEVEVWWPATVRDFILTDDLAAGLARLALVPDVPDLVNMCAGVAIRFDEIVMAMASERGVDVTVRSLDRPGIPAVVGDPSRLREATGVEPEMTAELIARTVTVDA